MSQDPNGLVIPSSGTLSGLTLVQDMDNALAALATQQAGATQPPGTLWPYSRWYDTANKVIKRRNAANSAWVLDAPGAEAFHVSKNASYTFALGDDGTATSITGSTANTYTIPASASLMDGWSVMMQNNTQQPQTIAPAGTDTLNGVNASLILAPGYGVLLVNNGASNTLALFFGSAAQGIAMPGAFKNLAASATGTNATVSVSADAVMLEDSNGFYKNAENVALSINSAAAGANGLDTGTLAASTWYSVWVIWNGSAAAGLLSASATAPTLPAGYTHKARIGWVRTDGTANKYPLSFRQYGRKVQYAMASGSNVTDYPIMTSGAQGTLTTTSYVWVAVAVSAFIPPTASSISLLLADNGSGNPPYMVANPNNVPATGLYGVIHPLVCNLTAATGGGMFSYAGSFILESSSIYVAATGGNCKCTGWEDNL